MKILGIGDQILDVTYKTNNKSPYEFAYSGGGTVWNILANLSFFFKKETYCLGNIGEDWAGTIIKKELSRLNIDYSFSSKVKYSKITHLTIPQDQLFLGDESIITTLVCPICNSTNKGTNKQIANNFPYIFENNNIIVCFESLRNDIIRLKEEALSKGWIVVYDLGFIGYLRYLDSQSILEKLKGIEYLQLHHSVAKFLLKKLDCNDYSCIRKKINCRILCVTAGSKGCTFNINIDHEYTFVYSPSQIEEILDSTGAGDAFFAGVLNTYIKYKEKNNIYNKEFFDEAFASGVQLAIKAISELGARGHINKLEFKKMKIDSNFCPSCKHNIKRLEKEEVILNHFNNKNIQNLFKRNIFNKQLNSNIDLIKEILSSNTNILITGSGGSFASAIFIADFINLQSNNFAFALKPSQVTKNILSKFEIIIALSYSGSSPDIINLLKNIKNKNNLYLLTLRKKESTVNNLSNKLIKIITYNNYLKVSSKEKGFLSFAGTIIPVSFFVKSVQFSTDDEGWYNYLLEIMSYWENLFNNNKKFITDFSQIKQVDIIYDEDSFPSAIDIESKFVESGLARATLHEKKDFSHGRFSLIHNLKSDLVLYLNQGESDYEVLLSNYLKNNYPKMKIFFIKYKDKSINPAFSFIIMSQILFFKIIEFNPDVNLKPQYPASALKLYKYKKNVNYNNETPTRNIKNWADNTKYEHINIK